MPTETEPTSTAAVSMSIRPFWRDPLFLIGAGYFVYTVAENLTGRPLTRDSIVQAALGAIVAVGRALAPYVRSFLPWFDRKTPGVDG